MPPRKRSGAPETSVADQSAPPPEVLTAAQKREKNLANLAGLRAGKAAQIARTHAARARGERSHWERYKTGDYPIDKWTDAEISKARPENLGGGFAGPRPNLNGKEYDLIKRELLKRGQLMMDDFFYDALKVLKDVAANGESEPARIKAASLLMERTAGKVAEKIEIKSSDPWQDILDEVLNDEVLAPVKQPASASASKTATKGKRVSER